MTNRRSRKRKVVWTLAVLLLLFVAVLALLPVWFPWVARPLARRAGVVWKSYEAQGYTRALVHGVEGQFGSVRIAADDLQLFLPNRWLWRHFFGGQETAPYVAAANWRLAVVPRKHRTSSRTNSVGAILDQISHLAPTLRRWLPEARLTNGIVLLPGQTLLVPQASLRDGRLTITATATNYHQTLMLHGDLTDPNQLGLTVELEPLGVNADLRLRSSAAQWALDGDATWHRNRVELTAQFGHDGLLPEVANVQADRIRLPAELVKLEGYQDLTGSFAVNWATNHYTFSIQANAAPKVTNALAAPPVALSIRGHGNTNAVTMEQFKVTTPFGEAELASATGLNVPRGGLTQPAELKLTLDLGALELTNFTGHITGLVRLEPHGTNLPLARFNVTGSDLTAAKFSAQQMAVVGRLSWPLLVLEQGEIQFDTNSVLSTTAQLDLKTRTVTKGQWRFAGGYLRRFLPTNLAYSTLQATGQFSGLLTQPAHSGAVTITGLTIPVVQPGDLHLNWRGEYLDLEQAEVVLQANTNRLRAGGAIRVSLTNQVRIDLALKTLDWQQGEETIYHLDHPASFLVRQNPQSPTESAWDIQVDDLQWLGTGREITLSAQTEWPSRGNISALIEQLDPDRFAGLLQVPLTHSLVESLALKANWDSGPMNLELNLTGRVPGPETSPVDVVARLQCDANGLNVQTLRLKADSIPTFSVTGRIPLLITPARPEQLIRFSQEIPFDLQARTAPTANLSRTLNELGKFTLVRPKLELDLTGNATDLKGALHLQLARATWTRPTNAVPVPPLEQVKLDARLEPDRLELSLLSLRLQGQEVTASGEWPLGAGGWAECLNQKKLPDWKQAQGRLKIANADLGPLTELFTGKLISQGQLQVEVALETGGLITGQVRITNAVTAPLPTLGPVRQLDATVTLSNRTATLESLTGQIAGTPISVSGQVDLANFQQPKFSGSLRATNLPVVRKPGIILRTDLDLHLASDESQPPKLSGQVTLRDSLLLQSLEMLAPRADSGSARRFPYFKVEAEPLATWGLDVTVTGDKFIRVRTPLFVGVASADFHVQGTLGDPQALGEARINSGRVTFPFGPLNVDSGFVTVNSDAPHRPRLAITASGQRYGYEIKMDVSGLADAPQILLTSSPPLSSGQILLLLTAGELPSDSAYFSQQQRAQTLAVFVGKDLLSRILGSESAEERLTINSGERISESGRSTYVIEYRLTDDWSLVGEYDRFDTLNAIVKWRFYSK